MDKLFSDENWIRKKSICPPVLEIPSQKLYTWFLRPSGALSPFFQSTHFWELQGTIPSSPSPILGMAIACIFSIYSLIPITTCTTSYLQVMLKVNFFGIETPVNAKWFNCIIIIIKNTLWQNMKLLNTIWYSLKILSVCQIRWVFYMKSVHIQKLISIISRKIHTFVKECKIWCWLYVLFDYKNLFGKKV